MRETLGLEPLRRTLIRDQLSWGGRYGPVVTDQVARWLQSALTRNYRERIHTEPLA